MGMAASQARYLALVARKSNCEYEGQQINQARTVLSNQTANLFNQMLGLQVPVPPSTSDFKKTQYSYSDGAHEYVIDSWNQLATPEEDYNYIVTRHSNVDVYTGVQKKLKDPQVQFQAGDAASIDQIENALKLVTEAKQAYNEALSATMSLKKEMGTLDKYADKTKFTNVSACEFNTENNTYNVTETTYLFHTIGSEKYDLFTDAASNGWYKKDGSYYSVVDNSLYTGSVDDLSRSKTENSTLFTGFNKLTDEAMRTRVKESIDALVEKGALPKEIQTDYASIYVDSAGNIAFKSDLRTLNNGLKSTLVVYPTEGADSISQKIETYESRMATLKSSEFLAMQAYNAAEEAYESLNRPTYIGNCKLTLLTELTDMQKAELTQVVKDMEQQDIKTSILNCFNPYGEYTGGVYEFQYNGVKYYTTFDDLYECYKSGTGINNIDGQKQLSYYYASFISQRKEDEVKALLQTDGNGRFTTVRFEDDTTTYNLNIEEIVDDAAYQDAMNQYYYENDVYDKMVQDINAKTSLIHQQDQQLELRLKQLDTEQNALSTEIDAVSKVVKDNVEKSFKTFGG